MTDEEFSKRAAGILHNMSLERTGFWNRIFRRWYISDEPLRNDAARLLRLQRITIPIPLGCMRVGDDT